MRTEKKSLMASIVMTGILFVVIVAAALTLPALLRLYSGATGRAYYENLLIALYASVPPAIICDVSLFVLLMNIRKDEVFVSKNVTLLRILSWCCFFVGVCYLALGMGYLSMLLLSFAAFFFGLILLVVKNVFERAISLREENDYTI